MNKILIIIIALTGFSDNICSQTNYQKRHVYGLIDDFYYLDILSDNSYKMKIGMYGNHFINGNYVLVNDTLVFESFEYQNYNYKISEEKFNSIKNILSKYLIFDSLLIPMNIEIKRNFMNYLNVDTNYISNYIQTDLHAYYRISLKTDSSFLYTTGTDRDNYQTQGNWLIKDSFLVLQPKESENLLHWICTDYKFAIIKNFIVGKTYNREDKITEYHYLMN